MRKFRNEKVQARQAAQQVRVKSDIVKLIIGLKKTAKSTLCQLHVM